MASVPEDSKHWTDEQWLAWLAELDAAAEASEPDEHDRPAPRDRIGARMLAASMRGLAEAIYGPKDEPAIVIEASGEPPPDGLDVTLDPDHPEQSVVVVRPWLLRHLRDGAADEP
ncbi:MAG TPA: hypothetical protein VFJ85_18180 [Acidimicrobiales bacterium]|nr:hypothetical protein [Acidimicrobiales bacterium]